MMTMRDTRHDSDFTEQTLHKTLQELARVQAEHEESKDHAQFLELTNQALQDKIASLEHEIEQQANDIADQTNQFSDLLAERNDELHAVSFDLVNKQQELSVLEYSLESKREEYDHLDREFQDYKQRFQDYKDKENIRLDEAQSIIAQSAEQQRELFLRDRRLTESLISELEEKNQRMEDQIRRLSQEIDDMQIEIEDLKKETIDSSREIENLNAQLNERNDYISELEEKAEEVRQEVRPIATLTALWHSLSGKKFIVPSDDEDDEDPKLMIVTHGEDGYEEIPEPDEKEPLQSGREIKIDRRPATPRSLCRSYRFWGFVFILVVGISGSFVFGYTCAKNGIFGKMMG